MMTTPSRWTHPICGRCWASLGYIDRTPHRIAEPEAEVCCWCLNPTTDGIYYRADPATFQCRGVHGAPA